MGSSLSISGVLERMQAFPLWCAVASVVTFHIFCLSMPSTVIMGEVPATAILTIFEGQFHVSQRFSISKLALKTVLKQFHGPQSL
jgi:hypothetical protein